MRHWRAKTIGSVLVFLFSISDGREGAWGQISYFEAVNESLSNVPSGSLWEDLGRYQEMDENANKVREAFIREVDMWRARRAARRRLPRTFMDDYCADIDLMNQLTEAQNAAILFAEERGAKFSDVSLGSIPGFAKDASEQRFDLGSFGTFEDGKWTVPSKSSWDVTGLWGDLVQLYSETGTRLGTVLSIGAQQLNSLGGGVSSNYDPDYIPWCLESRSQMETLKQQRLLKEADPGSPEYLNLVRRHHGPGSHVATTDRQGQNPGGSSSLSPSEKWKKLNASIEAYESAKYGPADRVAEQFNLESEREAYDNLIANANAEIERTGRQLEEKQREVAQAAARIQDLNEKIEQTIETIKDLQALKSRLEQKVAQTAQALNRVQGQNRALQNEIKQVNESIRAEQERLQALERQRAAEAANMQTMMGTIQLIGGIASMAGSMSASSYSGRSDSYESARSYSSGSSWGGSGSGGSGSIYGGGGGSRGGGTYQVQSKQQDLPSLYGGGGSSFQRQSPHEKIIEYRKNYPNLPYSRDLPVTR